MLEAAPRRAPRGSRRPGRPSCPRAPPCRRPAAACDERLSASSSSVASLSTSPSLDHAAVAVVGVLAQADVGDDQQLRQRLLDARGPPAARCRRRRRPPEPIGVLARRDAEQDHRRDAESLDLLAPRAPTRVDRQLEARPASTGSPSDALAGHDEERVDQVVGARRGLAHQAPQARRCGAGGGDARRESSRCALLGRPSLSKEASPAKQPSRPMPPLSGGGRLAVTPAPGNYSRAEALALIVEESGPVAPPAGVVKVFAELVERGVV